MTLVMLPVLPVPFKMIKADTGLLSFTSNTPMAHLKRFREKERQSTTLEEATTAPPYSHFQKD
jgi:hypothetical protein